MTPAQATWMDADPEGRDKPVTPATARPSRSMRLWYANLRFMAGLERRLGDAAAGASRDALADKVKASFNEKFWFATEDNRRAWGGTGGALRDVVEGRSPRRRDPAQHAVRGQPRRRPPDPRAPPRGRARRGARPADPQGREPCPTATALIARPTTRPSLRSRRTRPTTRARSGPG